MRPVRIAPIDATVHLGGNGVRYVRPTLPLGPYPERITERLEFWAACVPDRVFLADRDPAGAWREITYGETLDRVRRIGQALLDRGLSRERPILILSGNSIEHGLLALAAMHTVMYAPVAPAYSLQSTDFVALRRIVHLIDPRSYSRPTEPPSSARRARRCQAMSSSSPARRAATGRRRLFLSSARRLRPAPSIALGRRRRPAQGIAL